MGKSTSVNEEKIGKKYFNFIDQKKIRFLKIAGLVLG